MRRRQCGVVDVYEVESQSATQASSARRARSARSTVTGQVVAEALADRARLGARAEAGHLVVLHRVAVLVDDHLGVLGVVDAALAQRDRELQVPSR